MCSIYGLGIAFHYQAYGMSIYNQQSPLSLKHHHYFLHIYIVCFLRSSNEEHRTFPSTRTILVQVCIIIFRSFTLHVLLFRSAYDLHMNAQSLQEIRFLLTLSLALHKLSRKQECYTKHYLLHSSASTIENIDMFLKDSQKPNTRYGT